MKRHLITLLATAAISVGAITVFNYTVDPFRIFGQPATPGFNEIKSHIEPKQRMYETMHVLDNKPSFLIMGTSKEDFGIDPDHPVFQGNAFNGATTAQPYRETRLTLEKLDEAGSFPESVLIGLHFELANVFVDRPADFDEEALYSDNRIEMALSLDTALSSLETYLASTQGVMTNPITEKGFHIPVQFNQSLKSGQRNFFQKTEKHYLEKNQYPAPLCKSELDHPVTGYSRMNELRAVMAMAHKNKSDVRFFIGPSHARQWETLFANGLWEQFEEWKRRLVQMNDEESRKVDRQPLPIWDFSGYNEITTEEVPAIDDMESRMTNYFESSHYTPIVGNMVLNRVYGLDNENLIFGRTLESDDIESTLFAIRAERSRYVLSNPDDVQEIVDMADSLNKQCNIAE